MRVIVDERLQPFIHLFEPAPQEANRHVDIVLSVAAQRHAPISFRHYHLDQLPMTGYQLIQIIQL